jgi:hypothetical protein
VLYNLLNLKVMKKANYLFLIMLCSFASIITSCSSDDDDLDLPLNPTIEVEVDQEGNEFLPGTMLTFIIKAAPVDGILSQLVVTPSLTGGASCGLSSHVYNTSEDVAYMYEVPYQGGASVSINFAVTSVNEEDFSLKTTTSIDYLFTITNSFTEVNNVRLYSVLGDNSKKSLIRLDGGATYSYIESYDGDDALKLSIDMYASISVTEVDGVSTTNAFLNSTGAVTAGFNLYVNWGDGDWRPHRRHSSFFDAFTLYNQLNYDAFNPGDIFIGSRSTAIEVVVGDVITFDNGAVGGYNPDGDALIRTNNDVIGAIKILEINEGTVGDGSDGFIVFSYKYVNK